MELGGRSSSFSANTMADSRIFRLRPWHARGWHHPGAKLANHLFQLFRVFFHVGGVELIERDAQRGFHAPSLGCRIVTTVAVLGEEGLFRLSRGDRAGARWLRGLAGHPDDAQYDGDGAYQDFCSHDFVNPRIIAT